MNPVRALQLVRSLGGKPREVYVVGCEPAVLEREDGEMRLSAIVRAAVTPAVEMIEKLIADLRQGDRQNFLRAKIVATKLRSRAKSYRRYVWTTRPM